MEGAPLFFVTTFLVLPVAVVVAVDFLSMPTFIMEDGTVDGLTPLVAVVDEETAAAVLFEVVDLDIAKEDDVDAVDLTLLLLFAVDDIDGDGGGTPVLLLLPEDGIAEEGGLLVLLLVAATMTHPGGNLLLVLLVVLLVLLLL